MSELMAQQVQKNGGQIVTSISFGAGQSDFSVPARQLAQAEFDALFLPATSAQCALIAPALAAVGVWPSTPVLPATGRAVTYLIPSVGFSTELVARAGRYLQGAMFIVGFDGQRTEGAARFERAFRDQHNGAPSAYAAWGYDGIVMVSQAVSSGVKSRRELVSWLRGLSTSPELVMPFAGFSDEGNAVALPSVRQLAGDVLK